MSNYVSIGYVQLIAAIICAKWAMDLGYSQPRQLLWAIAGFVFAPIVLFFLYNRLLYKGPSPTEIGG